MNIAIDIRCLMEREQTGVGEYTFHLLRHLFEFDNKNHYYLFYNSRQNVAKIIPHFPKDNVHYCEFKLPNKVLNLMLKVFRYPALDRAIEYKYHTPRIDLFLFPNISFFKTRCPYFITAHDLSFEFFPEFLSLKRRLWHWFINPKKIFQGAESVIAVSKNTKQDLINCYSIPANKIKVIYSGVSSNYKIIHQDNEKTKKIKLKYKLPAKFVLFLGTIEPRKNLSALISAFQIFAEKNPEYALIIAGKRGWKDKNIIHGIDKKIIYTGFIPNADKRYLYNLASMFVYPSYYEGFGFPPLEAMACGCPVITANNSSLSEICSDAALLIDPNNVRDLADAMQEMTEKEIARHYREKGLEKIKTFNWYKTIQELIKMLRER